MDAWHRDAFFEELCVKLGFCSLGGDGEDAIVAALGDHEAMARAVFAAEGLDYETYQSEKVKAAVRDCIARHFDLEP